MQAKLIQTLRITAYYRCKINGKMSSIGTNSYHVHLFYHVETLYEKHEHISLELDMKLKNITKNKLEQLFLYKEPIDKNNITLSVYESQVF